MTQDTKILLAISIATFVILFGGVFFLSKGEEKQQAVLIDPLVLVKPYSHKIKSEGAKITIVEFADFQCPACAAAYPVIKQVLEDYEGEVNFVYRHFTLMQHPYAELASKASEAAGEQGKFWEMYDMLYENQNDWSESVNPLEQFTNYAKELGIDTETFTQKIQADGYNKIIQQDKSDGIALGVNATPTFFVNGKKLNSFSNLSSYVDQELNR